MRVYSGMDIKKFFIIDDHLKKIISGKGVENTND
jgi:hypothetical protein